VDKFLKNLFREGAGLMSPTAAETGIQVSEDRCIGCLACMQACAKGLITVTRGDGSLTLSFASSCHEEMCSRCAEACSEKALFLECGEAKPAMLIFGLSPCSRCGTPFIPERMLEKLSSALTSFYGAGPEDLSWLHKCPACRRKQSGPK